MWSIAAPMRRLTVSTFSVNLSRAADATLLPPCRFDSAFQLVHAGIFLFPPRVAPLRSNHTTDTLPHQRPKSGVRCRRVARVNAPFERVRFTSVCILKSFICVSKILHRHCAKRRRLSVCSSICRGYFGKTLPLPFLRLFLPRAFPARFLDNLLRDVAGHGIVMAELQRKVPAPLRHRAQIGRVAL